MRVVVSGGLECGSAATAFAADQFERSGNACPTQDFPPWTLEKRPDGKLVSFVPI